MLEDNEKMEAAMRVTYDLLSDEKMGEAVAKMYRNIFNALKKEGFTEDQALEIVKSFGKMK